MAEDRIDVFQVCRICGWRNTQSVYNRVRRDTSFPTPYPKQHNGDRMTFSRKEIERWWANMLWAKRESGGDQFVPYPGDEYYYMLLEK